MAKGNIIDIEGKKFGRWLVIEAVLIKNKHRWRCVCECGNESVIITNTLTSGRSKSCGCLRSKKTKERWAKHRKSLPKYHTAVLCFYNIYKSGAKDRDLEFNLSKDFFRKTIFDNCKYCGSGMREYSLGKDIARNHKLVCNGIDRIDNNVGYIEKNCVTCCSICNVMKHQLNELDFKQHILNIYNFLSLGDDNDNN